MTPTLKDVATLAGVSTATVSHVINDSRSITPVTRQRVERAIVELGFVPNLLARSLAKLKAAGDAVLDERRADGHESAGGAGGKAESNGDKRSQLLAAPATSSPTGAAQMILRTIRAAQPITRVEIARRLGVNRSIVTEVLKPLCATGLLQEVQESPQIGKGRITGRPPVALRFNAQSECIVGVSVGVRKTQVGVANLNGETLEEADFDTPRDGGEAMSLVRATVNRLYTKVAGRKWKFIGVSVPGPVDAERGKLLYAPHLGWREVEIADALRSELTCAGGQSVEVVVENDATAAAMYEARLRLRDKSEGGLSNFVLVRSGTGIGVGLVINNEVYRGTGDSQGLAGEFGHMTVVAGGKPCPCGNRGCWERYASAASASSLYVGDRVQFGGQTPPRYVEIVARAEAGELRARRTLERVGEYLGIGIANVITGLGVPRVILSGRIVYGWKFISPSLKEAVGLSMAGKLSDWTIEPGEPTGAGLGGALEVAADSFLTHILSR
jgi:predicted NBD/HSP70 family sugar kinase/ribosomal protein S25